ncbi:MAG TPA: type II toxin-antitoxin system VapC family toxin [Stellaceae bacterium]|nr:type II toxin-antitoxin system VapC family toxin [Stellaceae bacterium]
MPKTSEQAPLLLDTHVWLWEILAAGELSLAARRTINDAASDGRLRLSVISVWELALLASRKRVDLPKPTSVWIDEALARSRTTIEPLSPAIAVAACQLPGGFRFDPADQIIVATARVTGATLMTRDRRILEYAATGNLTATPA